MVDAEAKSLGYTCGFDFDDCPYVGRVVRSKPKHLQYFGESGARQRLTFTDEIHRYLLWSCFGHFVFKVVQRHNILETFLNPTWLNFSDWLWGLTCTLAQIEKKIGVSV